MQYTRNEIDFGRGTFRVRGDTVDVFPVEHAEDELREQLGFFRRENKLIEGARTCSVVDQLPMHLVHAFAQTGPMVNTCAGTWVRDMGNTVSAFEE